MNAFKKLKANRSVFVVLGLLLLILYTISFLFPLFWALLTSFRKEIYFMDRPFGWPENLPGFADYFANYRLVWDILYVPTSKYGNVYVVEMFYNSICYTVVCTITHTLTPCLAAYACAKYNFKFGKFMYGIVIVTMILPVIGNLASEIQVAKFVGAYNNLFGVAIMKGHFLGTNFLIFYAAFRSLPNDFKEAAEMDGANQMQILLQIVLPLVKTTIGAIALLSFISYWNDYTTAMIYLPDMPTIAYGLQYFTSSSSNESSNVPVVVSACTMITIPILIVFVLFKDKLIGNMAVGGIKG